MKIKDKMIKGKEKKVKKKKIKQYDYLTGKLVEIGETNE